MQRNDVGLNVVYCGLCDVLVGQNIVTIQQLFAAPKDDLYRRLRFGMCR